MPQPVRLYHQEVISDEIQDFISYRPHWIVRKGNAIFFLIVLLLLSVGWFIKYPDIINTSAKIVALNPPKLINAKVEGKLLKLFIANDQQVHKGQHLGYMEAT